MRRLSAHKMKQICYSGKSGERYKCVARDGREAFTFLSLYVALERDLEA